MLDATVSRDTNIMNGRTTRINQLPYPRDPGTSNTRFYVNHRIWDDVIKRVMLGNTYSNNSNTLIDRTGARIDNFPINRNNECPDGVLCYRVQ